MLFLHRTTESNWNSIQSERVLFGIGEHRRFTYLSPFDWGESYGPVLLKVNYEPTGMRAWRNSTTGEKLSGEKRDNFIFDEECPEGQMCDQFMVFNPIPLNSLKRIN